MQCPNENMSRNKYEKLKKNKDAMEKDNSRRKELGKFCLDMIKYTYTGMFLANVASFINNDMNIRNWLVIGSSLIIICGLLYSGYKLLNPKKK